MISSLMKLIRAVISHDDIAHPVPSHENDVGANHETPGDSLTTRWSFRGCVTEVDGACGMIEDQVYFSSESLNDTAMPIVGTTVDVVAERKHGIAGWRAVTVSIVTQIGPEVPDWDNENAGVESLTESANGSQHFTALVTKELRGGGILDGRFEFDKSDVSYDGYYPCRGDWVIAIQSPFGSMGKTMATDIRPLRVRHFEGVINAVKHSSHGYIDGNVYFAWNACVGFKPTRFDQVYGEAVETDHKTCQWRAFTVQKVSRAQDRLSMYNSRETSTNDQDLKDVLDSKEDVEVTTVDFGEIQLGGSDVQRMCIRNKSNSSVVLEKCFIYGGSSQFSLTEPTLKNTDLREQSADTGFCIAPEQEAVIKIECCAVNIGREDRLVILEFDHFKLGGQVKVDVTNGSETLLGPSEPYHRSRKSVKSRYRDGETWIVPGQRPLRSAAIMRLPQKLKQYPLPDSMRQWVEDCKNLTQLIPALDESLSILNYTRRFSALLHIEELTMEEDMSLYDIERACLERYLDFMTLEVPGLAEGRPSLLTGDRVYLSSPQGVQQGPLYEGFIHEVRKDCILLKFAEEFHRSYSGEEYYVSFTFSRTSLRRGHMAVELVVKLGEQGTGKTITIVEVILQIFHHLPFSRIVACTPSNSAADLLLERLYQSGLIRLTDMVRLNAFHRQEQSIPESILPYCSDGEDIQKLIHHRIIVCTCTAIGLVYSLGPKAGHFTHIIIDEAGQATEPECMVPIGLLAGTDGQIVLAGDPMQLGPVLRSNYAKDLGLGLSFLERLSLSPLYCRNEQRFANHGNYNPELVTKLVENYRSHPAILNIPSELFYDGELEISADPGLTKCLCLWNKLTNNENFPILFHGIRGEDMREGSSPSWFNPMEAVQVMKYLNALVGNDVQPLTCDDIGVITPYRKQVEKIRLLIDKLGMDTVKVGSVEEFQGQERLVMIISTVRSGESGINHDIRYNLGFISNPKRFNVAITRAQALLIIVGNPHTLAEDPCWKTMIQYCVANHAYTGCDLPRDITLYKSLQNQENSLANDGVHIEGQSGHMENPMQHISPQSPSTAFSGKTTSEVNDSSASGDKLLVNCPTGLVSTPTTINQNTDLTATQSTVNIVCSKQEEIDSGKKLNITDNDTGKTAVFDVVTSHMMLSSSSSIMPLLATSSQTTPPHTLYITSLATSSGVTCPDTSLSVNGSPVTSSPGTSVCVLSSSPSSSQLPGVLTTHSSSISTKAVDSPCTAVVGDTMPSTVVFSNLMTASPQEQTLLSSSQKLIKRNYLGKSVELDVEPSPKKEILVESSKELSAELLSIYPSSTESSHTETLIVEHPPMEDTIVKLPNGAMPPTNMSPSEWKPAAPSPIKYQCATQSPVESPDVTPFLTEPLFREPVPVKFNPADSLFVEALHAEVKPGVPTHTKPLARESTEHQSKGEVFTEPSLTGFQCADHSPRYLNLAEQSFTELLPAEPSPTESVLAEQLNTESVHLEQSSTESTYFQQSKTETLPAQELPGEIGYVPQSPTESVQAEQSDVETGHIEQSETEFVQAEQSCTDSVYVRAELDHMIQTSTKDLPAKQMAYLESSSTEPRHRLPLFRDPVQVKTLHASGKSKTENNQEVLQRKIIRQIEYYFGDINLQCDKFLLEKISQNPEQYVPLSIIMSFNRMKSLTSDMEVVTDALRRSTSGLVEVHPDGSQIRRSPQRPLPVNMEEWKKELKCRAIAVEGLAEHLRIDDIQDLFESLASVEHVHRGIRKYLGNHKHPFADLVIFTDEQGAQRVVHESDELHHKHHLTIYYGERLSSFCVQKFFLKRIIQGQRFQQGPGQRGENRRRKASKNTSWDDAAKVHGDSRLSRRSRTKSKSHVQDNSEMMPTNKTFTELSNKSQSGETSRISRKSECSEYYSNREHHIKSGVTKPWSRHSKLADENKFQYLAKLDDDDDDDNNDATDDFRHTPTQVESCELESVVHGRPQLPSFGRGVLGLISSKPDMKVGRWSGNQKSGSCTEKTAKQVQMCRNKHSKWNERHVPKELPLSSLDLQHMISIKPSAELSRNELAAHFHPSRRYLSEEEFIMINAEVVHLRDPDSRWLGEVQEMSDDLEKEFGQTEAAQQDDSNMEISECSVSSFCEEKTPSDNQILFYDGLDQTDSDVIVESSDEDILDENWT